MHSLSLRPGVDKDDRHPTTPSRCQMGWEKKPEIESDDVRKQKVHHDTEKSESIENAKSNMHLFLKANWYVFKTYSDLKQHF